MNDGPKTLADQQAIEERIGMLRLPHIAALTAYVDELRSHDFGDVPYFDPRDGGINASSLFLLEKPGPKAVVSGFISRNNNDDTAKNTYYFMEQARIDRKTTCLWNTVPGWNGTTKITRSELGAGADCLKQLFLLLPKLKVVVLVGRNAQQMAPLIKHLGIPILDSFHPSPKNYAFARQKWKKIPHEWMKVHDYIED